ncbi:Protein of uncharacterised function (DUF2502) [Serratia quinivorans]|jgi:hypothetical protein|uniref:DUF2502 domain-containing protein n=1 Tax=Serratia TaxID=613 RepID=UPI00035CC1CD|nr:MULTISPECIES: DUF2502 domain-containing protein [Serratia]CAI0729294.1 Protein of uncharacterised function (DUF2502) [Serratia quinivorans]CAI0929020.1 Protein of uncharacterised function (DUF2502) [Serratia quinivorans]CAI0932631.1 Protein of uncharacterised function (DUF2502) [Serratia quinivorans]CAI1516094.1 Protein of uncharacterised function (DUF2502) [Serratia quinivorans]CAI1528381.1 Protein of uncharacterised function (DUF2502) [Serratia quinivorans]
MKKILLLLAALLSLPLVSHADVSIGVNVPGLSLHIGDRDDRGHYWDGGRWRDPRWWSEHRGYEYRGYERPRGYYYGPPPRVIYYGPPRHEWRDRPHYRMPPPPPPGYYYRPGPRW